MSNPKDRTYGEWFVSVPPVDAQCVDHTLGARLSYSPNGDPEILAVQFGLEQGVVQLELKFADAMFLLSCLKSLQLDSGIPFPNDPRARSARG